MRERDEEAVNTHYFYNGQTKMSLVKITGNLVKPKYHNMRHGTGSCKVSVVFALPLLAILSFMVTPYNGIHPPLS